MTATIEIGKTKMRFYNVRDGRVKRLDHEEARLVYAAITTAYERTLREGTALVEMFRALAGALR